MILSMTGYGKSVRTYGEKKINVEIKSLNSKNLDLSTRIAPLYREKEMEIRQLVAQQLERGKIDFAIWIEKDVAIDASAINGALVENYYQQIKQIAQQSHIPEPTDWFGTLLSLPDNLIAFRQQEGRALQQKFHEKVDNIEQLLLSIEPYEKSRIEKIRQNLIKGLEQIPGVDYDQNRLEQELIYYIEKLDISEEKQRLANHLKYFRETNAKHRGEDER